MLSRFCPKPGKDKIYFIQDKTKCKKNPPARFKNPENIWLVFLLAII